MSVSSRVARRITRGGRALLHAIDRLTFPLLAALWNGLATLSRALYEIWRGIRPGWLRGAVSLGILVFAAYWLWLRSAVR